MTAAKRCNVCKHTKPPSEFHSDRSTKDGLTRKCKECFRAWRRANKATVNEINRRWRERNPEKFEEGRRRWRQQNPEKVAGYRRAWAEAHPEKQREARRRYAQDNPAVERNRNARRRARKKGAQGDHTAAEWEAMCELFGDRCAHCGVSAAEKKLTRDHAVPLSRGGSDHISNIQPLCADCNSKKGARSMPHSLSVPELMFLAGAFEDAANRKAKTWRRSLS